jgi:hypothetical protein
LFVYSQFAKVIGCESDLDVGEGHRATQEIAGRAPFAPFRSSSLMACNEKGRPESRPQKVVD